jgi:phospholipase C
MSERMARNASRLGLLGALLIAGCAASAAAAERKNTLPRYEHILVIIAENHGYRQIIGSRQAPNINGLAKRYGLATHFYGEVHPSKANYIAMIGGDTFGIHDDDAWYCTAGSSDSHCYEASRITPYVDHTVTAKSLADQLAEHNLTWRGYYESIPAAGSKAIYYPDPQNPVAGQPHELYAAKHNAFINFKTVQDDPALARKLVGFEELFADLASGQVPNYAHIVPNQCNEMHGRDGPDVPGDCLFSNDKGRIARGDKMIGGLVAKITASPIWSARGNTAIVITWDEDEGGATHPTPGPQGCCGYDRKSPANFGGGHIATLVITNHGPRHVVDQTPYNHYSLLRTTEAAFGIDEYLGHANDAAAGVTTMTRLFQTRTRRRAPLRR